MPETDVYTELLKQILSNQETFAKELQSIKDQISNAPNAPSVPSAPVIVVPPAQTGGLYDYRRPDPLEPRYGKGVKMAPITDAAEAKKRSMYAIDWTGTQCRSTDEDACWLEIEKLQAGDAATIARYDMMVPEFVGFGLLTNLFQPKRFQTPFIPWDQAPWAGKTIQYFLDEQWAIAQGGVTPSGT